MRRGWYSARRSAPPATVRSSGQSQVLPVGAHWAGLPYFRGAYLSLLGAILIHSRAINKALSQVNLLTYLSGGSSRKYHLWPWVMGHLILTQR